MKLIRNLIPFRLFTGSIVAEKQGQSLVEFALILPIMLLMLLGVFEVGYALRSYLALANVNREATRFAARGIYLDFDEKSDPTQVGYEKVVSHTLQSLASQLPLDMFGTNPNSVEFVSLYRIEPKSFACPGNSTCAGYNCSLFLDKNATINNSLNDIEYPYLWTSNTGDPNLPSYYNKTLALANTTAISSYFYYQGASGVYSKINPSDMVLELRAQSNYQNCQLLQKKQPPTNSDYVVVENIYYQKPIVGLLPFIGDTIPMYTHTVMRVTGNVRAAPVESTSTCDLYPIMVPASLVSGKNPGDQVSLPWNNGNEIGVSGNFGFVHWQAKDSNGSSGNQVTSLPSNLQHPENASIYYQEPDINPTDTQLNTGDWIEAYTGADVSVKDDLQDLVNSGKYMRMPVWYDGDCNPSLPTGAKCTQATGTGNTAKYRVMTFVVMKIVTQELTGSPKKITFQFDHFDSNGCTGDGK
jgi:hypothetical protein